jgi:hypothetical protein
MFTLAHEYEVKDDSLLRGEGLAIVATMLTRLERIPFKHHSMIPVRLPSVIQHRVCLILMFPCASGHGKENGNG